ncbi:MAG TPA: DNA polymerase III subunit gamma/tau [Termitinemataceae bacterium]|nr:DNA polymerase III subunit gamma/tau [Termitinemataceae bacterium]HOM23187.1 DNA polymerase III subunit gamma/tau [Termitinemataceae bacterium]HPQ00373.1 DNA polymerase III subunit gamma/tau [Termitinemataceae bacterium]
MAYEVTANRRRPKTFDELAGQEFVVATLKSAIQSGRIAHAYLFSGPRGCGKTSAARILARSLNCEKGPTPTPCGVCTNCQEIARGTSLDVIEIDGASNTSVNDVRQIKDEVLFPPNSGRYKVYIIDEVHMLSNSAFNALLKTIEEPPPYIIFIFATTELHKVPATIKSRCQQFNFRLIPIDTIKSILKETCEEMGIQAEEEALFWIAKESTGSLRDAYTLFDQVVAFSEGFLRTELIREKLGLVGFDAVNSLAEACVAENSQEALSQLDHIIERGVSIEQCITDLAHYYRSILLLKNGITKDSLLGYSAERFSQRVINELTIPQVEQALELLLQAYRNIRYTLSPRFELERVISQLCWLKRWISPEELSQSLERVKEFLINPKEGVRGTQGGNPPTPSGSFSVPPQQRGLQKSGAPKGMFSAKDSAPQQSGVSGGAVSDRTTSTVAHTTDTENITPKSSPGTNTPPEYGREPFSLSEEFKRMMAERAQSEKPLGVQREIREEKSEHIGEPPHPSTGRQTTAGIPSFQPEKKEKPDAGRIAPSVLPQNLDISTLKEKCISLLKHERGLLASSLEKTAPWTLEGNKLSVPVQDTLTGELIRKDMPVLSQTLHKLGLTGIEIQVTISEAPPTEKKGEKEIPPEVEMVRRLFRGTIITLG